MLRGGSAFAGKHAHRALVYIKGRFPGGHMHLDRRKFLAGSVAAGALPRHSSAAAAPALKELDRAAARPVLRVEGLKSPVVIDSMRLLKKDGEYIVHVRSKDGAEGISVCNPPRADFLDRIFKELVAPLLHREGRARSRKPAVGSSTGGKDNYKLYGMALWSLQAWAEFAILDMLGRIAGKPIGALIGDVRRKEIARLRRQRTAATRRRRRRSSISAACCREIRRASAIKFRLGGRMSRNADAMPGRTDTLIPLARKTFGDDIDLHGDANSTYDPAARHPRRPHARGISSPSTTKSPASSTHLEDTKMVTRHPHHPGRAAASRSTATGASAGSSPTTSATSSSRTCSTTAA